jgi:hypothetical protein
LESAIARQVTEFMLTAVGQEGVPKCCLPEATGWLVQVETKERSEGDVEWVSMYELRLDHALNVIGCRRASVRQEPSAASPPPEVPAPVSATPAPVAPPPDPPSRIRPDPPLAKPPAAPETPARLPHPLPPRPAPRSPRINYRR